MNRDAFLARVRDAAEQGKAYRVHIHPFPADTGYVGVREDLCERTALEITAVGGEAVIVGSLEEARERLAAMIDESAATSALCWRHDVLDRLALDKLLDAKRITRHDAETTAALTDEQRRVIQLACGIGITSVECAIAETGSLLLWSKPGQERVASLLPPVHVAVVERAQIVPDLLDAFDRLQSRGVDALPSNLTFVTGPSKTGDIELQLTTGIHGPGTWRVIIVRAA